MASPPHRDRAAQCLPGVGRLHRDSGLSARGRGDPPHPDRAAGGVPPSEADSPPRLEFVDHGLEECGNHAPPEDVDLPVGWFRYTAAGTGCLHLPGSAAGGEYLIGVASTSELPSSLTPVSLSGTPGDPSVAATSPAAVARPGAGTGSVSSRARIAAGAGAPPPPGRPPTSSARTSPCG